MVVLYDVVCIVLRVVAIATLVPCALDLWKWQIEDWKRGD